MTAMTIPSDDHGQIRVFATDAPLPQEILSKTPNGMLALFGAPLNPDFVDIVKIDDLNGMALTRYIAEGYDMTPDPVDAALVDQISGYAVLVLSRATNAERTELHPGFGLRHITTYSPASGISVTDALTSTAAKGTLDGAPVKPKKSNARMSGMVATFALLAMFVLVALMIWIGG